MNPSAADISVFQAIADPTRRQILAHLRTCGGELTPTQITEPLSVTLSAVSQHLKILRDTGLVSVRRAGRERWYRLDASPIREIADWVREYEGFWNERMDALGAYLDEEEQDERRETVHGDGDREPENGE